MKKSNETYKPRTKHLNDNGTPKYTNSLFLETSPYLLQHAHNPVNWYPWGKEAFTKAAELGYPIFLSVGYSTCHWCHVMEEESFEDLEIAEFLNKNYISIKVDREERPDIDAIYMSAVQSLTGKGGWPLSLWLTNDQKPFYGGTYFPARDGDYGVQYGFLTILKKIKEIVASKSDEVHKTAQELADIISSQFKLNQPKSSLQSGTGTETGTRTGIMPEMLPEEDSLHLVADYYYQTFDFINGGLIGAPKFPSSFPIRLILRYYRRTQKNKFLQMINLTLSNMANGGIYDHVGGGFHRYSTDEDWLVPHFEKMLYDNALLVVAYAEAYQVTRNEDFIQICRKTLDYILREMTSEDGAFYSSTDADSLNSSGHREEGIFFTWALDEIEAILDAKEAKFIKYYYGVTEKGNFEGRNIFYVSKPIVEVAEKLALTTKEAEEILSSALNKLYKARAERPAPIRDEKILTSWNALMISAFAKVGFILNDNRYLLAAKNATIFILKKLFINGRLYRSFTDGQARLNGYLDDYTFLIAALLDLYEATGEIKWYKNAVNLDETLNKFYEDNEDNGGGFFRTSHDHEKLIAREKPYFDGAEPSGNSIAMLNLLRLYEFTNKEDYRRRYERGFKVFDNLLKTKPMIFSELLLAVDYYLDDPKEVVIVFPENFSGNNFRDIIEHPMIDVLRNTFLPNKIVVIVKDITELKEQEKIMPILEWKVDLKIADVPVAYVCRKRVCLLPTSNISEFAMHITEVKKLNY
ncbi:MAG: thioredoxin domain-containing protein [Oligoflexia bacterium]|nr:thioredoxin domain-containing protein [Oligoflexia bacterium]